MRDKIINAVLCLAMLAFVFGILWLKVQLYGGDWRCAIAECRISK